MVQIPRLREWREARALTQVELARLAHVSSRSVAGYEAGAGARPPTVRRLAEVLGIEVADLRGDTDSPKAPRRSSLEPSLFDGVDDERRRAELAKWLEERCGHAYLALPKGEFEEIFDRIPEDAPERRELALKVNREYNIFCDFPRNVTPAERLSMRRMIRAAIPEVAVKHGIALMEGGLSREYQEEAARIFEVQSATESATA